MKIGIGVTTYKRPKCLEKWKEQINKTTLIDNATIYIAEDTDANRKGVAYRKNECLRALTECDYVFLFDDDCYPIKQGWIEYFVQSGYEHLIYCNPNSHKLRNKIGDLLIYKDCGGVFMFMQKSAIDRVGGFNEIFGIYGFEHAEYSERILGSKSYPVLENTNEYIYAEDYSNKNHKSSITSDEKVKHAYKNISLSQSKYINKYIPL